MAEAPQRKCSACGEGGKMVMCERCDKVYDAVVSGMSERVKLLEAVAEAAKAHLAAMLSEAACSQCVRSINGGTYNCSKHDGKAGEAERALVNALHALDSHDEEVKRG